MKLNMAYKKHFGKFRAFPADRDSEKFLELFTGPKESLSEEEIEVLIELGVEIKEVPLPRN